MNRTTLLIVENNQDDRVTEIRPSNGTRSGVREEDFMASHSGKKAMVVISVMALGI